MVARNDAKDHANGSEEPKPETGFATLATLRYENNNTILLRDYNLPRVFANIVYTESA